MKKLFTLVLLCISLFSIAQNDSIFLGADSKNMVFYNIHFTPHTKTTVPNDDWHIAFSVRPAAFPNNTNQSAAIRINEAFGLKLYHSTQKLSNFSTFDTTGWQGWQRMHNPDTTWTIGAFNINKDFASAYNYGWGTYQFAHHNVVGDSTLYLLQLPDSTFRKLAILNLAYDTAFNIQYSNLDNTGLSTLEIRKKPYRTKNFVYLNLNNQTIMDKEPALTDWSMVFLRYNHTNIDTANLSQDMGVLTNDSHLCATDSSGAGLTGWCVDTQHYSYYINQIGQTSKYHPSEVLVPNKHYFIRHDPTGLFRISFTTWGSATDGNITLQLADCEFVGINDIATDKLTLYPIPATDKLLLKLNSTSPSPAIQVYDMIGKLLITDDKPQPVDAGTYSLNIATLQSGNYIVSVTIDGNRINKLISVIK